MNDLIVNDEMLTLKSSIPFGTVYVIKSATFCIKNRNARHLFVK
jgi:hypothetical protein